MQKKPLRKCVGCVMVWLKQARSIDLIHICVMGNASDILRKCRKSAWLNVPIL